jgi:hypothetical protein
MDYIPKIKIKPLAAKMRKRRKKEPTTSNDFRSARSLAKKRKVTGARFKNSFASPCDFCAFLRQRKSSYPVRFIFPLAVLHS